MSELVSRDSPVVPGNFLAVFCHSLRQPSLFQEGAARIKANLADTALTKPTKPRTTVWPQVAATGLPLYRSLFPAVAHAAHSRPLGAPATDLAVSVAVGQ